MLLFATRVAIHIACESTHMLLLQMDSTLIICVTHFVASKRQSLPTPLFA